MKMRVIASVLATCTVALSSAAQGSPQPGEKPPEYVGVTSEGTPVVVGSDAGPATVISFWATWCKFCLKEIDVLNKIQNVGGDSVRVLMVNIESAEVFRAVTGKLAPLKLKIALLHDPDGKAQAAYGVAAIPHMFIVGRQGRIVAVYKGYSEGDLDQIIADINSAMTAAP
jgi:thiol-disulfide isomerase/thioredoxin